MNIYDQMCSLKLAKLLKKLRVKQESLFYYFSYENPLNGNLSEDVVPEDFWMVGYKNEKSYKNSDWEISAFTVAELGEMLPSSFEYEIEEEFNIFNFIEWKIDGKFICNYYSSFPKKIYHISQENHFIENKESDARAKMLIYLIENKII